MTNTQKKMLAAAICAAAAADLAIWGRFVALPLAQKLGGGASTAALVELCGAVIEGELIAMGCLALKYERLWKEAKAQAEK